MFGVVRFRSPTPRNTVRSTQARIRSDPRLTRYASSFIGPNVQPRICRRIPAVAMNSHWTGAAPELVIVESTGGNQPKTNCSVGFRASTLSSPSRDPCRRLLTWHNPLFTGRKAWTRSWQSIIPIGLWQKLNPHAGSLPFSEPPNSGIQVLYTMYRPPKSKPDQYHHAQRTNRHLFSRRPYPA